MRSREERSIIKDIYDHFDELADGFLPRTKEYELTKAQNNKLEHEFIDQLSDEQKKMFYKIFESKISEAVMELAEAYRQGVCLGVTLTSEAFVTNRNKDAVFTV